MKIHNARREDFDRIYDFYLTVIEEMQNAEYRPGWQKGVYPAEDYVLEAVEQGILYYGEEDGEVAAAMILNSSHADAYDSCRLWKVDAAPEEVLVIHTLAVSLHRQGKGIARKMVEFAIEKGRADGKKAIRLDVLKGNVPAERLYPGLGFEFIETVKIFYEDTGLENFHLFELAL